MPGCPGLTVKRIVRPALPPGWSAFRRCKHGTFSSGHKISTYSHIRLTKRGHVTRDHANFARPRVDRAVRAEQRGGQLVNSWNCRQNP